MLSEQSVREELDRAIGDGPAHPAVADRIKAGRRALLRRRVGSGVAAFTVVVLTGTGVYAVLPGEPVGRGSGQVAVDPTPSPTPTPTSAPVAWEGDEPARYVDGELQIRPGATVHQHLVNPYGYEPPKFSDALDLTFKGKRLWVLLEGGRKGYGTSYSPPSNGWAGFEDYIADQVDGPDQNQDGWPETLMLFPTGDVVASDGSEIIQRTDDPKLGPDFAGADIATGAALVTAGEDGVTYFVVWRVLPGELDVITTPLDDFVGATFQELLTYARSQYASGEGLR